MAGLKDIKLKIQSVQKTGKVTRAMEAVSAVKMRKSQDRALTSRPYALHALAVLARISGTADMSRHPLGEKRDGDCAVIVVTSDKGLAGALNSALLREAEIALKERSLTNKNTRIIAIGRRGAEYFANRGYDVRERLENVSDDVTDAELQTVTDTVLSWHASGEIASAIILYTNFVSTFEQRPVTRGLIPLTEEAVRSIVAGIPPVRGRMMEDTADVPAPVAYAVEPDADSVMAALLPRLVNVVAFHALMEAKASEHSARMVAMKNATDKSKEVAKELNLAFNKARQAAITREVSEITSGMEAMH